MQNSIQVSTGPLLKQFATKVGEEEVALTSKLGTTTVSRVRFKRISYPRDLATQEDFVASLVDELSPSARQELNTQFEACISDQVKALNLLLQQERPAT